MKHEKLKRAQALDSEIAIHESMERSAEELLTEFKRWEGTMNAEENTGAYVQVSMNNVKISFNIPANLLAAFMKKHAAARLKVLRKQFDDL